MFEDLSPQNDPYNVIEGILSDISNNLERKTIIDIDLDNISIQIQFTGEVITVSCVDDTFDNVVGSEDRTFYDIDEFVDWLNLVMKMFAADIQYTTIEDFNLVSRIETYNTDTEKLYRYGPNHVITSTPVEEVTISEFHQSITSGSNDFNTAELKSDISSEELLLIYTQTVNTSAVYYYVYESVVISVTKSNKENRSNFLFSLPNRKMIPKSIAEADTVYYVDDSIAEVGGIVAHTI